MPSPRELRVLLLAANPADYDNINVTREHGVVRAELRAPAVASRVRVDNDASTAAKDFLDILDRADPQILHFSGHGNAKGEPVLLASDGEGAQPIPGELLEEILRCARSLRCVVLNTCYSSRIAQALTRRLPIVVIGMSARIGDEAARQFAQQLYSGIARGKDLQSAFDAACTAIKVLDEKHGDLPQLSVNFEVEPDTVVLLPRPVGAVEEAVAPVEPAAEATDEVSPERRSEFVTMLLSMFSSNEFVRLLRYGTDTAEILHVLPAENAPPITLFDAAVEQLVRRRLLGEAFFQRVIKERPRREAEIRRMQAKLRGGAKG